MKRKIIFLVQHCSIFAFLFVTGCSGLSTSGTQITFTEDVTIAIDGQERKVKAGETIESTQSPIYITRQGRLPMLVLPLHSKQEQMTLSLKKIDENAINKSFLHENKFALNQLMEKGAIIQRMLSTGNVKESQQKLDLLIEQNPEIGFFKLLLASTELMQGRKEQAKSLVEQVLQVNPESELARDFYVHLTGNSNSTLKLETQKDTP